MSLIANLANLLSGEPNYRAYNINNTKISYGAPPHRLFGVNRFEAWHAYDHSKHFPTLGGGSGTFVTNRNLAGIIEIEIMSTTASCMTIELIEDSGVAAPIAAADLSSGGTSFCLGSACRKIKTPKWRRSAKNGFVVYTFEVARLLYKTGTMLPA